MIATRFDSDFPTNFNMTKTQKNVTLVLKRLAKLVEDGTVDAEHVIDPLDDMLTQLNSEDAFGTEGQLDPRGDFRDGEWSVDNVQK